MLDAEEKKRVGELTKTLTMLEGSDTLLDKKYVSLQVLYSLLGVEHE